MQSDSTLPDGYPPNALPRGTRLGEFELLQVLGVGGFGIVYLAFDHALEREVAVKEYMPSMFAGRTATMHVSLRTKSDADTFALGLKSYVNEARLLARFDHPSLVKVLRFWEANGTAYMAMPVYRGLNLKEFRRQMQSPPDEAWLRKILSHLLGAIDRLHSEGVYHRDIAPDNIQIEADGRPVLLDFGAARRVIGDTSQTLTAILKPAYAPIEQYGEAGSVKQGPWTDLYALGATLHFLLLGRPPPPATARALHDDMRPLSSMALLGCTAEFLQVLDWMLAPRPADRPQSVAALRAVLEGSAALPFRVGAPQSATAADWERTTELLPHGRAQGRDATGPIDDDATMVVPNRPSNAPTPEAIALPDARQAQQKSGGPRAVLGAGSTSKRKIALSVLAGIGALAGAAWTFLPRPAVITPSAGLEPAAGASDAALQPGAAPRPASATMTEPEPAPGIAATPPLQVTGATEVAVPELIGSQNGRATGGQAVAPRLEASKPKVAASPSARNAVVLGPRSEVVAPVLPAPASGTRASEALEAKAEAARPSASTVQGPRERCGSRVLFALWSCMDRQCAKPELHDHPECVKLRLENEKILNTKQ